MTLVEHQAKHPEQRLLVEVCGIDLGRGGKPILSGVDLTVRSGEIVTLIGPNGSGKTTLIRVILGLVKPDSGRIWQAAGLRIGYVPQSLAVDRTLPLTVRRFLTLPRPHPSDEVRAVLTRVRAETLLESQMSDLSGGELQRVLLARALLHNPDLLVLDEPTQSLDFAGQIELYRLCAELRDQLGCGVLMVSHDLHLVMAATDRVLCLNRHVCCAGVPEAVIKHPEYLALFGRTVAGELAVYAHTHNHGHDVDGGVVPLDASDRDARSPEAAPSSKLAG